MTTQVRWPAAFIVQHGDRYFINNEPGSLIIAQFPPEEYVESDRTKLIEATGRSGHGSGRGD